MQGGALVTVVNGWKPFTIITKSSPLDVAAVLDPRLIVGLDWHTHILNLLCVPFMSTKNELLIIIEIYTKIVNNK